jgi:hypothetical protein
MRKFLLTALVTIGMIGSSVAQMAIPGEIFADAPARFNGRKVTLKNIQLVGTMPGTNQAAIVGSPVGPLNAGPGAVGPVTPTTVHSPCRPPRGFSKVDVFFTGKPEFKTCFFMSDMMKTQLDRELGGQQVDAQITFRGDYRTGYNVTFYRLGR